jgi:hypothetical protein
MTKLDFLQIMGYLGAAIGRDLPEKSMDVYFDLLGDLPAEVMFTAARRVILEHKWTTFPRIAEIREAALQTLRGKVTEISPAEAWQLGWRAASRIDPEIDGSLERACQSLPPLVFEAMKAFGINALCYGKEPVSIVRGQFMKILEAAGIPYAVDGPDGPLYADFHSLRHAFVGLLDKSGASLKQAMQLARHSDPKLTMARYGRAQLHDLAAAIDRLPCFVSMDSKPALSATGTQGPEAPILQARLDRALTKPMLPDGVSVMTPENATLPSSKIGGCEKPRKRQEMRTPESECEHLSKLRPAGFEPATLGLGNRCSIP